jgi:hypothetical protein
MTDRLSARRLTPKEQQKYDTINDNQIWLERENNVQDIHQIFSIFDKDLIVHIELCKSRRGAIVWPKEPYTSMTMVI